MTPTHTPGPCKDCSATVQESRYYASGTVTKDLLCGCSVYGYGNLKEPWHVHQCPLHLSAPALLEALKQAITDIKTLRTIQHSGMTLPHIQEYLEQAIAQAEGKKP